jgi:N-acetylmuramoyl-L-alanine amidase
LNSRDFLKRYAYIYCYVLSFFLIVAAMIRHSVQTVSSQQDLSSQIRIVIDAGHGGIDGGTTSVSGVLEKELNLQIAQRLEKLMLLLGHKPIMTRTTGESVATEGETIREQKRSDLQNRVELVNQSSHTILVSIHQNHYPDSKYTGPQIFYADDEISRSLAQQLQQTMNAALSTRRETKKADGVYLMSHINCPGILVECGFLSNHEEDARLQTPQHQKVLCCLIAASLMEYVKTPTV